MESKDFAYLPCRNAVFSLKSCREKKVEKVSFTECIVICIVLWTPLRGGGKKLCVFGHSEGEQAIPRCAKDKRAGSECNGFMV